MASFIVVQRVQHEVPPAIACRALGVSPAWFYKWRGGDVSLRRARRRALGELVAVLFRQHRGTYGSPRITADLREAGWRISEKTVAALMAEQHLLARGQRRRKSTTRPGRGRWRTPDLVGRKFSAQRPNQRWFGDGKQIPTAEGKAVSAQRARDRVAADRRVHRQRAPRRRRRLRCAVDGGRGPRRQRRRGRVPYRPGQ